MAMAADVDPGAEGGPAATAHPLRRVAELLAAIGTLWILALMLLVVADVVGRNFLDAPITGVAEFASRSVASIVFLTLAAAICAGRMTRSDFVPRLLGSRAPGLVKALDVGNALLGVLLFAGLAVIYKLAKRPRGLMRGNSATNGPHSMKRFMDQVVRVDGRMDWLAASSCLLGGVDGVIDPPMPA